MPAERLSLNLAIAELFQRNPSVVGVVSNHSLQARAITAKLTPKLGLLALAPIQTSYPTRKRLMGSAITKAGSGLEKKTVIVSAMTGTHCAGMKRR